MDRSGSDLRLLKGFSTISGVRSDAMMGTTGVLMGGGTILAILGDEEVIGTPKESILYFSLLQTQMALSLATNVDMMCCRFRQQSSSYTETTSWMSQAVSSRQAWWTCMCTSLEAAGRQGLRHARLKASSATSLKRASPLLSAYWAQTASPAGRQAYRLLQDLQLSC